MAVTDPWDPDTPSLLEAGTVTGQIVRASSSVGGPLHVEDAEITFDATWAPHVQGTMTVPLLPVTLMNLLDPRRGARVTMEVGYKRAGVAEDVHPLLDCRLLSRPARRPDNTHVLRFASDESLVQSWAPIGGAAATQNAGTMVTTAMANLVKLALPAAAITLTQVEPSHVLAQPVPVPGGQSPWPLIQGIATQWGYVCRDLGLRAWECKQRAQLAGTEVLTIRHGANLVTSESELAVGGSDDGNTWANAVVLVWESSGTSNPAENKGYWEQTTGPYSPAAGAPRHVLKISLPGTAPALFADRNARAASVGPRVLARGRTVTVEAPAAYWVRPDCTVRVYLPSWSESRLMLVDRVTFRPKIGRMEVVCRMPDDGAITGGE